MTRSDMTKIAPRFMWFLVVVAILLSAILYTRSARREYRAKIVALMSQVSNHREREEVRQLLGESRFQGLTLREDSSTEWEVETPNEFGAKNWVLYMDVSDSRIAALRVRTADSVKD